MDWLLLRGLAREQRHWRGFREQLERASGARVCCVDVAGAGTERARVPWPSLRWLARDVARRLPGWAGADRAGQRWNVLGLSLGGMVALELCRSFPDRFGAALIVNASSCLSPARARLAPRAALQLARAARGDDPLERERIILDLTSALPEAERARVARRCAELARAAPSPRRAVLSQLIAAARFRPPPRRALRARLGFVCSRRDRLVDPRCSRDLASFYASGCDEHPWAGHDLPLDDPAWLCDRAAELVGGSTSGHDP